MEGICKLTKDQISPHSKRLSVESYETFYETTLHPEVKRQYQVNVKCLKDLLLSPRSRKYNDGYTTCSCCYSKMQLKMAKREYPPKFAIENRFVIGSFPQRIEFYLKDGNKQVRTIKDDDLTDMVKAILAPIRLYGSVFLYSGGAQK
jgi:hypothetical protein